MRGALFLGMLWLLAGCASAAAGPKPILAQPAPEAISIACAGAFTQGGLALCKTSPNAEIVVDGTPRGQADAQGMVVIGFDRDAPAQAVILASVASGGEARLVQPIAARTWVIQRVDGLPPETVTPTKPEVLARIQRDTALKAAAIKGRAPMEGWLTAFNWPLSGTITGRWGNQRVLNGEPRTPHYGVDIAAPTGTPIAAPGPAVVTLAETDMHFEGGLVFLDHGQGLYSYYLHMSRVDVKVGDIVQTGQVLGAVGATGRATGPHLCWRMRWRDRQIDPAQAVEALAIARAAFKAPG